MAYQTGSVANGTILKDTLITFMLSNGYTLSSVFDQQSNFYTKGLSTVRLTDCFANQLTRIHNIRNNEVRAYWKYSKSAYLMNTQLGDTWKIHSDDPNFDQEVGIVIEVNSPNNDGENYVELEITGMGTGNGTVYPPNTYIERIAWSGVEQSIVVHCEGDTNRWTQLWVKEQNWPVTYHLFASDTQISCVVVYGVTIATLFIGEIVKVHTDAFVGGEWAFGSSNTKTPLINPPDCRMAYVTLAAVESPTSTSTCCALPFSGGGHTGGFQKPYSDATRIHVEIDGHSWPTDAESYSGRGFSHRVIPTKSTMYGIFGGLNPYNGQAQLVPIHLQHLMEGNLEAYIGYLDHMRCIRVDNYNIGDILTIGSDSWMIFPWCLKNTDARNGGLGHSGTLGFAIRYVL